MVRNGAWVRRVGVGRWVVGGVLGMLLVVAVWNVVRDRWVGWQAAVNSRWGTVEVLAGNRKVCVMWGGRAVGVPWIEYVRRDIRLTASPPGIMPDRILVDGPGLRWRRLGVSVYGDFSGKHYVAFPGWYVVAVLAIYPVVLVVRALRRRGRVAAGMCVGCGYDLRAQAKGGRCPECGMRFDGEGGSSNRR